MPNTEAWLMTNHDMDGIDSPVIKQSCTEGTPAKRNRLALCSLDPSARLTKIKLVYIAGQTAIGNVPVSRLSATITLPTNALPESLAGGDIATQSFPGDDGRINAHHGMFHHLLGRIPAISSPSFSYPLTVLHGTMNAPMNSVTEFKCLMQD